MHVSLVTLQLVSPQEPFLSIASTPTGPTLVPLGVRFVLPSVATKITVLRKGTTAARENAAEAFSTAGGHRDGDNSGSGGRLVEEDVVHHAGGHVVQRRADAILESIYGIIIS